MLKEMAVKRGKHSDLDALVSSFMERADKKKDGKITVK